ncbi:hypothetical protein ECRN5871_2382 [Escherichia coli RN587/1]|uniref:Uncharacterized protein n=1 Tax=Escherichia coli DEC2D TaxID=868141 RepID=A0A828U3C5_ECOLX|nr:hypothetical protein EC236275_3894 [Escherichia coli 2362-75]EFW68524.1 hypothetical protein EcoM_03924 [Escherichia coli WV_060327]EFZ74640.1 hypothetical protein ECRN5871_2382 [Escherichia coli RN587/1]EHU39911.1 hypothetical protein ECDEC2D_4219 [Escherichia coli DEC2D]EHU51131.1 hypothetical protein ECDEC2E_4281 [Escherichia coli DEC2E]EKI23303.1 hypothetical protein ECARS42123_4106 [Escherichia coli ARS4.2123]
MGLCRVKFCKDKFVLFVFDCLYNVGKYSGAVCDVILLFLK